MTACIVLRQSNAVHMLTDSASYDEDGRVVSLCAPKVVTIPTLSAAICARGWSKDGAALADHMAASFRSFEEIERYGEVHLPAMYQAIADRFHDGDACCSLSIIGWSTTGPRAYSILLQTDGSTKRAEMIARQPDIDFGARMNVLREREIHGVEPDNFSKCGFRLPESADQMTIGHLVHLIEIERNALVKGRYWVGGKVTLTSITSADGLPSIVQHIVHEWPEDQPGEFISPRPIDWSRFQCDPPSFEKLSRQQRRALERGKRRVH